MRMSNQQYLDYLARTQPQPKSKGGCDDEAFLHTQITEHCRAKGWLAFHGSMAHKTFRVPGEPDYVLLLPEGKTLLVECKTRTGKLSVDQLGIQAWAEKLGHKVYVVRSYDEFIELTKSV